MRDNLVFSHISESAGEDVNAMVKSFIKTHLKLEENTVKNSPDTMDSIESDKKSGAGRSCPIVAKSGYFKQKEQVKSQTSV